MRQVTRPDARQHGAADAARERAAGAGASPDAAASAGDDADAAPRRRAVDAGSVAEEARQLYRASLAAGDPLTGRQLGSLYNRSPSWGRTRIGEAKSNGEQASDTKPRQVAFAGPSPIHHPITKSAVARTGDQTVPVAA